MDVFSRAIVGLAVTLEGPSWLSAMLALENTLMNKVEFCSEFGIEIEESEWPCCGLPTKILADRGEMEGAIAEGMIKPMRIALQNTAPYRADWKGGVEQSFRRSKSTPPQAVGLSSDLIEQVYLRIRCFFVTLNVFAHHFRRHFVAHGSGEVSVFPELSAPQLSLDLWKLAEHGSRAQTFETCHHLRD